MGGFRQKSIFRTLVYLAHMKLEGEVCLVYGKINFQKFYDMVGEALYLVLNAKCIEKKSGYIVSSPVVHYFEISFVFFLSILLLWRGKKSRRRGEISISVVSSLKGEEMFFRFIFLIFFSP